MNRTCGISEPYDGVCAPALVAGAIPATEGAPVLREAWEMARGVAGAADRAGALIESRRYFPRRSGDLRRPRPSAIRRFLQAFLDTHRWWP
ncbi:hypothetical protein OG292_22795 [Streptomyces sp. NBC_01511]|uniref:hypothetical protein n=1 Tax=Streptomyces sp. NBC_01511 TaxID=2903889 RepID=UPI00386E1628